MVSASVLVKAVAEMHKAELEFANNLPGLTVRITFPLNRPLNNTEIPNHAAPHD